MLTSYFSIVLFLLYKESDFEVTSIVFVHLLLVFSTSSVQLMGP
jgi:hypothetical protein